jgi:hypothetical protein
MAMGMRDGNAGTEATTARLWRNWRDADGG